MKAIYQRIGRPRTTWGFKWCSLCNECWPVKCFTRSRGMPDGRENRCKACRSERRKCLAGKTTTTHD